MKLQMNEIHVINGRSAILILRRRILHGAKRLLDLGLRRGDPTALLFLR
jgi:hypothetical protein